MRWFYELLSLSLSVTPIIILLLCINPMLKKRYSAKWRYILWTAVSICLLLPFYYVKNFLASFRVTETVQNGILPSTSVDVGKLPKINHINLYNVNGSLGEVLLVIYIVGVILYMAYVIFSYIAFRRDIFRWSRKTSNYEQTILREEKKRLNVKRNVPILISKKVLSPMLVGFIRPTLMLPSEVYTPEELRMIFTHELIHFKRNDIFIKTIFMVASVVHWFNPFVHLMVKQANKDMEQSCDDYALYGADVEGKKFYCSIILKMAKLNNSTGSVFSTNMISSKKNLESRIKDIFDNSKKRRGTSVLITLILTVIISGTILNLSGAESPQNDALNEPINVANENEIIHKNKAGNESENSRKSEFVDDELENNAPAGESDQAKNVDIAALETPSVIYDNTQPTDKNQENHIETQEEIIAEAAEIVIVDLKQLENQLHESDTVIN